MAENLNLPVLEWSVGYVDLFLPSSGQTVTGRTAFDVASHIGGQPVVLALSRQSAFVRTTRLPDVSKADMRRILMLQFADLLPMNPHEAAIDIIPVDDKTSEGRLVVVGAVMADVLQTALEEMRSAGIKVSRVVPAAMASIPLAKQSEVRNGAVVGTFAGKYTIDVLESGGLKSSRSVETSDIAAEVRRSLAASGLADAAVLATRNVEVPGATKVGSDPLAALATGFEMHLETPQALAKKEEAHVAKARGLAMLLLVACVGTGAVIYDIRSSASDKVETAIKATTKKTAELKKLNDAEQKKSAGLRDQQAVIELCLSPKQPIGDVITVMCQLVPKDVWLSGLSIERGKRATLRGTAMDNLAVASYVRSMAQQSRLKDVKLDYSNDAKVEKTPVVNFSISTHVVGNQPLPDSHNLPSGGKK